MRAPALPILLVQKEEELPFILKKGEGHMAKIFVPGRLAPDTLITMEVRGAHSIELMDAGAADRAVVALNKDKSVW